MKTTFQTWRFPLVLALALSALLAWQPPFRGGDVIEYLGTTVALAAHHSPDIRMEDIARSKELAPELAGLYDMLADDMRNNREHVFPAFARGREGKVYPIHFFGYSALATAPFMVLEKLHRSPLRAFQIVNLAALFALGLALRRFFRSELKAFAGLGLFMLCGGLLYWDWTSPECVSAAGLLAGLLLFASGSPLAGSMLAGLAGQQNPTIMFFFGFAPLLLALQHRSRGLAPLAAVQATLTRRNLAGLALGMAVFAMPPLFNLYQFGVPNIIVKMFSDSSLVSLIRLESFYFDLNQGMILAIPAVLAALLFWGWGRGAARRGHMLDLAACALFTLALAVPALAVLNWNSGAAGVMRYAFWAAMPFLFALLLRLRDHARWPAALLVPLVAVQAGCMWYAKSYSYVEFSPLANALLQRAPGLYHPEPEIFAERMGHNDDYIQPDKIYVYKVAGRAVKTLVHAANPGADTLLCGEGGAISPASRIVESAHGWRYIDGAVHCLEGGMPQQRFQADQFAAGAGISLASGWSVIERSGGAWNGAWSNAARSRLLVTPADTLHPAAISLTGQYLEGNKQTRISINGIDLGWHRLDLDGPIALPPALAQARTLEIELTHQAPHAPGPGDPRQLAFFLREVYLRGSASTTAQTR